MVEYWGWGVAIAGTDTKKTNFDMASPVPNSILFEPWSFGDVWLTAWGSINPGLTLYEGPVEFQWKLTRLLVGYFTFPQSQYLPWVSIACYVRLGVHRYTAFQTHSTMIH